MKKVETMVDYLAALWVVTKAEKTAGKLVDKKVESLVANWGEMTVATMVARKAAKKVEK